MTFQDHMRRARSGGRLAGVLGRPVPIALFDMYRAGEELALTMAANPAEVVADYVAWHRDEEPPPLRPA
ncbi:hypothetical protein [Streptomyces sp. NPDC018031]|uniref:hypothetical protein n=1 Tax=Streptomyces sp. NPDC018031 TaxID=3365033 RepID=UPI00379EF20A